MQDEKIVQAFTMFKYQDEQKSYDLHSWEVADRYFAGMDTMDQMACFSATNVKTHNKTPHSAHLTS